MRHNKKFNHLGRTASHRDAMLSNMATSLIMHKRISTTTAKAKALKRYIEPLLTKAKLDNDMTSQVLSKQKIRDGRYYKKHGVAWADGNAMRSVYGYNLSKRDRQAIATKIANKEYQTHKRKTVTKKVIAATPVILSVGVAVFNANRNKISSHLSPDAVKKGNNFINKYNRVVYKYGL